MATSEEGSDPSHTAAPWPLAQVQVQELEPRVARRRQSQARHRATLTKLFGNLRRIVYQQSDFTASKVGGPEFGEGKPLYVEGLWGQVGTGLEAAPPIPTPEGWGLPGWVSDQLWTPRGAAPASVWLCSVPCSAGLSVPPPVWSHGLLFLLLLALAEC